MRVVVVANSASPSPRATVSRAPNASMNNAIESIRGARGHPIARASVVHRARGRADVDARTDDDGGDARARDGDLVVVVGGGGVHGVVVIDVHRTRSVRSLSRATSTRTRTTISRVSIDARGRWSALADVERRSIDEHAAECENLMFPETVEAQETLAEME